MSIYMSGDVLWVSYDTVTVGRALTAREAQFLNAGDLPAGWTKVEWPTVRVHWFPVCGGVERRDLSRSIRSTTCRRCLAKRANDLRGWRWTAPHNEEDVAHIRRTLGAERADAIGLRPADDSPWGL
jgi:hypothetical protein